MATKRCLPKLTPPRQTGVLDRARLFDLLDDSRAGPVTWICGPAGAGKTTLAATYIARRKLPGAWYQFDATDADPAVLFHHLRQCVAASRPALPQFVDRYQAGMEEFARRFFRSFFSRCPPKFVLVLDGVEPVHSGSVLAQAAQEVPTGMHMVLLSRDEPPPAFARLELAHQVARIGWESLRLTPEETHAIVAKEAEVTKLDAPALHRQCAGWIAGLRLVLELRKSTGQWSGTPGTDPSNALFRFIASEVFDRLTTPTQEALLRTSLLPEVSAHMAAHLTRNPQAGALIEALASRHLFVDRLEGTSPVYRYHALFGEFLAVRARQVMTAFDYRTLQREAGELLVAAGRMEHAIGLLTQAGEWLRASRLILEQASNMLARGHSHTLRQWVQALPAWYVDATPRLLYCLGLAQSTAQPDQAIDSLERAYHRFVAQRNALGQALCAAGIIQAYYFRLDTYVGMERWGEALDGLLAAGIDLPSAETELHLLSMMQVALTYRMPGHPHLAQCAQRILALIARNIEVNQRVVSAALLLPYCDWVEPGKSAFVTSVVRPLLKARELTPFNHLWWLMAEAQHCYCGDTGDGMQRIIGEIDAVARKGGLRLSAVIAPTLSAMLQLISGTPRESMEGLSGALRSLNPGRRQEGLNLILYAADLLTHAGDFPAAVDCAARGVAICRDTGLVLAEMETQGLLSVALCEHGRLDEALAALQAAREIAQHIASPKVDFHHLLIEAYIRLKLAQRDRARELLRQAFVLAREQEFLKGYLWAPRMMAHLCNEALDAGIEPAHVRRIIGTRKLPPPDAQAAEAWPWPVKIYVLGRFEILLDGQILRPDGKAQKKPLELVRALVARGPGDMDQSIIAQDLWPDSEGDAAESAARMTVHRLRKLLRHEDTILVQEGKLRLNPERCWVDAWALERACRTLEADGSASKPRHWIPIERVLKLYQGEAFGTQALQPWMLAARDRWRSKFLRAVRAQGGAHEQSASWREAADLYQAGIETDPLCEEFYQALMRCQIAQGKQAEAYDTYRRCRDVLFVTHGIKPSAATESLRSKFVQRGAA